MNLQCSLRQQLTPFLLRVYPFFPFLTLTFHMPSTLIWLPIGNLYFTKYKRQRKNNQANYIQCLSTYLNSLRDRKRWSPTPHAGNLDVKFDNQERRGEIQKNTFHLPILPGQCHDWAAALQLQCPYLPCTTQGKKRQSYGTLCKPSAFQQHNCIVDGLRAAYDPQSSAGRDMLNPLSQS